MIFSCCSTHVGLKGFTPKMFTPSPTQICPSDPAPLFLCPLPRMLRAPAVFTCSLVPLLRCSCSFVNKVSCLSHSHLKQKNKHPFIEKTPITSAGMSHQAMSTTALVGCLNSCSITYLCVCLRCSTSRRSYALLILFSLLRLQG